MMAPWTFAWSFLVKPARRVSKSDILKGYCKGSRVECDEATGHENRANLYPNLRSPIARLVVRFPNLDIAESGVSLQFPPESAEYEPSHVRFLQYISSCKV